MSRGEGKGEQFQIILLGDAHVGKTSLIETYITLHFPEKVESIMNDSIIPPPSHDEYMSCILCDSSDNPKDPVLLQKLRSSDVVFLLHDASRPSTLESLKNTWLPLVQAAFGSDRTKSAVIIRSKNDLFTGVVDYRLKSSDKKKESNIEFDDSGDAISHDGSDTIFSADKNSRKEDTETADAMTFSYMGVDVTQPDKFSQAELDVGKAYPFISALSIVSAAKSLDQVVDLFTSAEEMFRCPLAPLYTKELGYTARCLVALQRVFRHHDQDHDGVLSDEEFKRLQYFSLGVTISDDELYQMKSLIDESCSGEGSLDHNSGLSSIWTNLFDTGGSNIFSFTGHMVGPRSLVGINGITFHGFCKILEMHICRDRQGVVWEILHAHGYSVDLRTPPVLTMCHGSSQVNEVDNNEEEEVNYQLSHVEAKQHPDCINFMSCSSNLCSSSWQDVPSSNDGSRQSLSDIIPLLSHEAIDFLYGLFTQKRRINKNENMTAKISAELTFAVSVLPPAVSRIWLSIAIAIDSLISWDDSSSSVSQSSSEATPLHRVSESSESTLESTFQCHSPDSSMYALYNPMPSDTAFQRWLTLWHSLAITSPPSFTASLLHQLGFLPSTMLTGDGHAPHDASISLLTQSDFDSTSPDGSKRPPPCFVCNCLETCSGRALENIAVNKKAETSRFSVRNSVRKIGVFGKDSVGKTSIIASFSDLFSNSQKDQISQRVRVHDRVVGGYCVPVHHSSKTTSAESDLQGSGRKHRKSKSKSSQRDVDSSSMQAPSYVHYIAIEVPRCKLDSPDEESTGSFLKKSCQAEEHSFSQISNMTSENTDLPPPTLSTSDIRSPGAWKAESSSQRAYSSINSEDMFSFSDAHSSAPESKQKLEFHSENRLKMPHEEQTDMTEHATIATTDATAAVSRSLSEEGNLFGSEYESESCCSSDSSTGSVPLATRRWIEDNKKTTDIALLVFNAFEIDTFDYLLHIDSLLPPEVVRVFVCTKFGLAQNVAASSSDEAYEKCVEFIRDRGLPQVEQLFSLDESSINSLKRSVHDTYQRAAASMSKSHSAVKGNDSGLFSELSLSLDMSSSVNDSTARSPFNNCADDDDDDEENEAFESRESSLGSPLSLLLPLSLRNIFSLCDSFISQYVPSYKLFLPHLVLGLIALCKKSSYFEMLEHKFLQLASSV